MKKKTAGMLVAVEIDAVLNKYAASLTEAEHAGFRVLTAETERCRLVIVHTGAGEIAAAAGTQLLISEYKADWILNFGVVGGLTEEMTLTRTCVVEKVVHYDFDTGEADGTPVGRYLEYPDIYLPTDAALLEKARRICPSLTPVICASADKFVADPEKKRELHRRFGADICEMEAAGIVLTCNRSRVPCLLIKAVSDSITGGAQEFWNTVGEAAAVCLEIADRIMEEV